jgi:hypothetical protein
MVAGEEEEEEDGEVGVKDTRTQELRKMLIVQTN